MKTMDTRSSTNYFPSNDEEFMNGEMRLFFKEKLLSWKEELLQLGDATISILQENDVMMPDVVDQANSATLHSLELRTRDRHRKLINKIDEALARIDEGTYGYCEETGDPIAINRLVARPIATLSLEAQQRHELKEKKYGE